MTTSIEQLVKRGLRLHLAFEAAISVLLIVALVVAHVKDVVSTAAALVASTAVVMLYTYFAGALYMRSLREDAKSIVRFYLIHSGARLVVYGVVSALCTLILSDAEVYRPFLALICTHFMLTVIAESILFVKLEKRLNENK